MSGAALAAKSTPTKPNKDKGQEVGCVSQVTAELRTGPGEKFEVAMRVNRNTPFILGEKKRSWLKVTDLDQESFWVLDKAISRNEKCVVVKVENAYLRKGPGKEFVSNDDIKVDRFTPLRKIKKQRGWLEVETPSHQQLWIYGINVWDPAEE